MENDDNFQRKNAVTNIFRNNRIGEFPGILKWTWS